MKLIRRETVDIPRFTKGIIAAIDQTDIPVDSAIWANDIDPDVYPGELANRVQDAISIAATSEGDNLRTGAGFIHRSDGTKDLIYYDDSGTGTIVHIDNWPGTTETSAVTSIGTAKTVSIQPQNDCAYVEWRSDSSSATKWVGYIPYGQYWWKCSS